MTWAAIRHRRVQAVVIGLLSALVTACAVFAPLYERALEQALVRSSLSGAPVDASGLSLTSRSLDPAQVATTDELEQRVPPRFRAVAGEPVASTRITVQTGVAANAPAGTLLSRQGACEHVSFAQGRCPAGRDEVAVSAADSTAWAWRVGHRVRLFEVVPTVDTATTPSRVMTVVGVYRQRPGAYWFNTPLVGQSGTVDPQSGQVSLDTILTSPAAMAGPPAVATGGESPPVGDSTRSWMARVNEVDVPLRTADVDLDTLGPVASEVADLITRSTSSQVSLSVRSALPDLDAEVNRGREQARVIVPLLMLQLAVLAVVVLRLVLAAAIDQRRPEVALARLRGRGVTGARRLLVGELGSVVLLGVPVGFAAALVLCAAARHAWLVPGVPAELPAGALVAVALAATVSLTTVVVTAGPTAKGQISALLRTVPARRRGWRVGAADAVAVTLAVGGLAAMLSGNLTGPLALASPMLVALACGLMVAHLMVPVSSALGRRLLGRGRVAGGLTALQIARRPAVRQTVAILTIATALVVFAGDALLVGERNRRDRAQVETGAALVVTVTPADVLATRAALAQVDPGGRDATPVLRVPSAAPGGTTTQAVLPDQFRRLAFFPGEDPDRLDWAALRPPAEPPLQVVGRSLTASIAGVDVHPQAGGPASTSDAPPAPSVGAVTGEGTPSAARPAPPQVGLQLVATDGSRSTVMLGDVPYGRTPARRVRAAVGCAKGCQVRGLLVVGPLQTVTAGRFRLLQLRVDGAPPLPLGRTGEWDDLAGGESGDEMSVRGDGADPTSAVVSYANPSTLQVQLRHASAPAVLPALVAGPLPPASTGDVFASPGLDGVNRAMTRAAGVRYVPGGSADVALVNLDSLQRDGGAPPALSSLQVWVGRDDADLLARLSARLHDHGLTVSSTARAGDAQRTFDRSAPAWGLQLALVVGLAALTMAGMVLVVVVATSWRQRARDYAGLRMSGLAPRTVRLAAVGEQLVVVTVATIAGAACGLLGAALTLPVVPMFTTTPVVSVLDASPAWGAVGIAAAASLALLAGLAVVVGRDLASRSTLERVREPM